LIALDEEMDNVEKFDGINNQSKMPPTLLPTLWLSNYIPRIKYHRRENELQLTDPKMHQVQRRHGKHGI
jgi:hypothetical protein